MRALAHARKWRGAAKEAAAHPAAKIIECGGSYNDNIEASAEADGSEAAMKIMAYGSK